MSYQTNLDHRGATESSQAIAPARVLREPERVDHAWGDSRHKLSIVNEPLPATVGGPLIREQPLGETPEFSNSISWSL